MGRAKLLQNNRFILDIKWCQLTNSRDISYRWCPAIIFVFQQVFYLSSARCFTIVAPILPSFIEIYVSNTHVQPVKSLFMDKVVTVVIVYNLETCMLNCSLTIQVCYVFNFSFSPIFWVNDKNFINPYHSHSLSYYTNNIKLLPQSSWILYLDENGYPWTNSSSLMEIHFLMEV